MDVASRTMRYTLHSWCETARERFPELRFPSAEMLLSLGAAKMETVKQHRDWLEAIREFTSGLEAPDAAKFRPSLLLNRALAWSQFGLAVKAIEDYTAAIQERGLRPETRVSTTPPKRATTLRTSPTGRLCW